ncbi:MAG TPA: carbohydrate ABC transporter permease [Chloroflexota bacterium]|nr:carbohydrate ABC transporter permease [Chloroflexota bacterium]
MSELAGTVATRSPARTGSRLGRSILHGILFLALVAGSVLMIGPFIWMVSTSLKADGDVLVYPPTWIPAPAEWGNYLKVLVLLPFGRYLINTTVVTISVTFLEVLTSSLAAYSFARLNFPGRDRLFLIYLGTLMVPGQVTIIPNFLLISVFGWVDSYFALIIPAAFTAFGTFLLRQFFLSIPPELEQAARIDGCGYFGIYRHIILPLSGPALATLTIFSFMAQWNSFLWPLIVTNSDNVRTLTVGLSYFQDEYATQFNYMMAGAVLNVIPILIVFLALQRYFVRGIALTGITGR